MKILFVIAALRNGGAERVLQVLANYFARANDVTIAILENDEGRYKFSEKIKFLHLDVYKNGGRFDKYRILRECFKRERPSVIISFMDWTNVACVIASFGLGIPLICKAGFLAACAICAIKKQTRLRCLRAQTLSTIRDLSKTASSCITPFSARFAIPMALSET